MNFLSREQMKMHHSFFYQFLKILSLKNASVKQAWNSINYESTPPFNFECIGPSFGRISLGFTLAMLTLLLTFGNGISQSNINYTYSVDSCLVLGKTKYSYKYTIIPQAFESNSDGWTMNGNSAAASRYFGGAVLGNWFLGRFGSGDYIQKTFNLNQKSHRITFDLYRLDSWDDEYFQVFVGNGSSLLISQTFKYNIAVNQQKGSSFGYFFSINPISIVNIPYLGAPTPIWPMNWTDQIVRITIDVPPGLPTLTIKMASTLNQAATDESWGIDNFAITCTEFDVPVGVNTVDAIVVGGGGGGASDGGSGGGGGEIRYGTIDVSDISKLTILPDVGGLGGSSGLFGSYSGNASIIKNDSTTLFQSNGGSGGFGWNSITNNTGGSGGSGGFGIQGGNGGYGPELNSSFEPNGNNGTLITTSCSSNYYGGGGAGGRRTENQNSSPFLGVNGGLGGGGQGANYRIATNGSASIFGSTSGFDGEDGTGGGGGGGNYIGGSERTNGGRGGSGSVVISYFGRIRASISNQTNVTCASDSGGSVTATVTNGTSNYDFEWSNGASTYDSGLDYNSISGLTAGIYTVTVTDENGNTATTSATINIIDTIPPIVSTQNITIYLDENGNASIVPGDVDNNSTDNCTISAMTVLPNSFTCADIGSRTVTLKVTDASGNINTETSTVTILDSIAPIALANNIDVYLNYNGTASITAVDINDGSSDNCSITNMNVYPNDFNQTNIGENIIVFEVIDQCGNRDSTFVMVTVKDTIPPTLLAQNITVYLDTHGKAMITSNQLDKGSFDNCGIDTIILSQYEFSCAEIGENNINFKAVDLNQNIATKQVIISVIDTIKPTVTTKNTALYLDKNGEAKITASQVNFGSFDNCGIASLHLSDSNFRYTDGDRMVLDLFVKDVNGNINSAPAVIYLIDTIAPDIVCPNSFGSCDIEITYELPAVADNTEIEHFEQIAGLQPGDTFDIGTTTNTYVATDISGNQSSCSFEIERYQLPTVSAITDTTVYYAERLSIAFSDSLAVSYHWTPSDFLSDAYIKNPICSPTENINYTVEVTSANGCKASDNVNVTVLNEIKFAKAFSPNGDGQNDFFEIYGIELYPNCKITVLNRLGTVVFASQGYSTPWDGTYKNEMLPVASYFYVIELGNSQKPLTGSISIIR